MKQQTRNKIFSVLGPVIVALLMAMIVFNNPFSSTKESSRNLRGGGPVLRTTTRRPTYTTRRPMASTYPPQR